METGAPAPSDDEPERTLAAVYRRHADFVWRVVRRFGIPDAVVEDVMHDVFLVVHRRLHEFDGRAAMTTWLYNIARGVASNYRRGHTREEARLRLIEPHAGASLDPEGTAERREAAAFVRAFVASLDDDRRQVFELAVLEAMPIPQVAEACGINVNTAYSRLRSARKLFQAAALRHRSERSRSGVA